MTTKRTLEFLPCPFTEAELREFGTEMARSQRKTAELTLRKKEVVKALDGEIEAASNLVQRTANKINDGYEYRDVECEVRLDQPEAGIKTIIRLDTGEVVKETRMSAEEKQLVLELAKPQEDKPKEDEKPKSAHSNLRGIESMDSHPVITQ